MFAEAGYLSYHGYKRHPFILDDELTEVGTHRLSLNDDKKKHYKSGRDKKLINFPQYRRQHFLSLTKYLIDN